MFLHTPKQTMPEELPPTATPTPILSSITPNDSWGDIVTDDGVTIPDDYVPEYLLPNNVPPNDVSTDED